MPWGLKEGNGVLVKADGRAIYSGMDLQWKARGGGCAVNKGERPTPVSSQETPVFPLEPLQPLNQ